MSRLNNPVKFIITLVILLGATLSADVFGQVQVEKSELTDQKEKSNLRNRFIIGGGLGLQFGTITLIDVSPVIGYRITERFVAGIGGTYQYYKENFNDPTYPDYSANIYGGSIYARYYVWRDLFGHAEYQYLTYTPWNKDVRVDVNSYLLGAGYRAWLGNNFAATIVVLFDLNEGMYSLYQNPIMRIGFQVGI